MTAPPVGPRQEGGAARTAPIRTAPVRRRRRWPVVLLIVLLLLVAVGVAAAIVGDRIFRDRAEAQIEQSVNAGLPAGVQGRVEAEITGFSALQQWATGRFDQITLRSRGLTVAGAPASATAQLYGLPVNGGRVTEATARLSVAQSAFRDIPALRRVNASAPVLGNGTVSTTLRQSILGLPVAVKVVLKPSLQGRVVQLDPAAATLTAGPASVPATAIVRQLLPNGVPVCAASYLPEGVAVTGVAARPGTAEVRLRAQNVDLARLGSGRTGSCG